MVKSTISLHPLHLLRNRQRITLFSDELNELSALETLTFFIIFFSMFDIYQRYLANCKPHHKRLSIMQAHEIIHREHTFQAKYGKKQENDVKAKDQTSDTMSSDKTSIKSAQVVRREKKPQYSIRTMNFPTKNVKENETKLIAHAAQCSWFKTDILESGILRKDSDTKGKCCD